MIEETDMGIPQLLRRLDEVTQSCKICPKLDEGDGDANLHE
jgi:hypothetical protein